MASRGLRKTYFFSQLKACERRNLDFCVFFRLSAYINRFLTGRLPTHKNQSVSSHKPSNGKIMFFVIPEMPSKTFVKLYKKNFLITLSNPDVEIWPRDVTQYKNRQM